jgi:uncharacterized protein YgbK (DUF1537 family)
MLPMTTMRGNQPSSSEFPPQARQYLSDGRYTAGADEHTRMREPAESGPLLSIVADDLAGAADTAAQLATPESPAFVSLGPQPSRLPEGAGNVSAWAVDADCRHVEVRECAARIRNAFGELARLGSGHSYIKLDSTLRGNVGAALETAHEVEGGQGVVLASAFPDRGRTVVGGVLLVDGKPVAETEIGADGAAPVTASDVSGIVGHQWLCRSAVFQPRDSNGPRELAARLATAICDGFELLVMDSESPQDLRMIAAALNDDRLAREWRGVLPAGSAGLARGFAEVMNVHRITPPPPPAATEAAPVLALIGSRTAIASEQAQALIQAGIKCLAADASEIVRRASTILDNGGSVALIPGACDHEGAAAIAAEILGRAGPTSLVLSGGATARRFCELAGIAHMWIIGELQPGVAAGHAIVTEGEAVPLVIKGGAAGNAQAVLEAIKWLRGT